MDANDLDDLISRLQARVADPDRRVDIRARTFDRGVAGLGLGDLVGHGQGLAMQLLRVVDAKQAGRLRAAARSFVPAIVAR